MKMTKKILVGAVAAVAMAFSFTGCDLLLGNWSMTSAVQKTFGTDFFDYSDSTYDAGNGTWTVKKENTKLKGAAENEGDDYIRGVKLLLTKHSDMAAVAKIYDQTANSKDGVIGVAFDVTSRDVEDNEGNTTTYYDFMIAGLRYDSADNVGAQYYVSYFANVTEAEIGKYNLGAYTYNESKKTYSDKTKNAYVADSTECYEIAVKGLTKIAAEPDADGTVTVVIDVDEAEDGSYKIQFVSADAYDADNHVYDASKGKVYATETVKGSTINKTEAAQAYIGVYGNIYPATAADTPTKLHASLEVMDLTNGAIAY